MSLSNIQKLYNLKLPKFTNKLLLGVDEVARGCFVGPVVSACVVLNIPYLHSLSKEQLKNIPLIADSKKLKPIQRQKAEQWIKNKGCLAYGIGIGSVEEIDNFNIREANFLAMNRAILNCLKELSINNTIDHNNINLLIDGNDFKIQSEYENELKDIPWNTLIKGDSKDLTIACASIIAKEWRDRYINNLVIQNKNLKVYNWHKNKGYGTKEHQKLILQHGITSYHRLSFLNKLLGNNK
tara:strand:+ start:70 stop:786 length:717 start_codon:yes stop_codon:yes gene_type:complete